MTRLGEAGRDYLKHERGFNDATINKFGIHSIENGVAIFSELVKKYSVAEIKNAGLMNNRGGFIFNEPGILIPCKIKGEVVYYIYRNMKGNSNRKYLCMAGRAKHYFTGDLEESIAYVFEGVIDAMSFYQLFGMGNIIACSGVGGADNDKILNYLGQYGCRTDLRFIYLLDNDEAGQAKVKELQKKGEKAYILSDWVEESKCCLEVSGMKDWNEVLVKSG
ncbi:MAG: toprim domain-containing protein [Candidatus Cloacimonetes bacterium]|nr:toprim domain-containing protein [Candidatus Cloacimonadota bacterium]